MDDCTVTTYTDTIHEKKAEIAVDVVAPNQLIDQIF